MGGAVMDNHAVPPARCQHCEEPIPASGGYRLEAGIFCEACALERGLKPRRKTHWQYLGSIKTGYLVEPGE